jgi:hypothetical protein
MKTMKLIITVLFMICLINSEAQIYKTNHFKIFYTKLDDKNIKEIADSVENNYTRIITNLQSTELQTVRIYYYTDTSNFRKALNFGQKVPAWVIGITHSDSAIHMLSPNASSEDYQPMIRSTIHEFAHCVSGHINPTIPNKPRWLWEAVAIYESNQTSDPRHLTYLINQKPPTLKELNDLSKPYVYQVGYFITEYLVEIKGNDVLNALIKNNGNIQQTLNMDDEELTRQWFAFVKKKYGI